MTNKRLLHDVAMATTTAVLELFRWSDEAEYRKVFNLVFTAIEGGILYALTAQEREWDRLAKILKVPKPMEN